MLQWNMTSQQERLNDFDPFISRKLNHDLDKYEIRSIDNSSIRDWIANALVTEQLLGLLRTGYINIVGWDKDAKNGGSPLFEQAEFTQQE
jgi:hypothetical protein